MNLVFSSVFEQDFAELVLQFASSGSAATAGKFEDNTYDLIETLVKTPEAGRLRRDLRPAGIRSFRIRGFERYLLFYRVNGEDLVLLRLRHGAMNLPEVFLMFQ